MKKLVLAVMAVLAISMQAVTVKEFTIPGSVGKLWAQLELPEVQPGEKVPLVILCHGFGGNSRGELFDDISSDLLADGIATLRFDFNGHGKSEGAFENMTVPNEIEDLGHVIEWAEGEKWVKSISLLGHSQGGVVASMAAGALGSGVISGLVLMAPAAVLRDDALRGNTMGTLYDPWDIKGEYVELAGSGLKLGRNYIESAKSLPIYETARNYDGPVFLVHGTHDRIVPYTYSQRYDDCYGNSVLTLIEGDDHGFTRQTAQTARLVSDWLSSCIGE